MCAVLIVAGRFRPGVHSGYPAASIGFMAWPISNPAMQSCQAFLQELAGKGVTMASFYLRNGRRFGLDPKSAPGSHGVPNACYANAAALAERCQDLRYCEGFALRPGLVPVHHAWCIDIKGVVVDPTWRHVAGTDYFGVVFRRDYLTRALAENGRAGILVDRIPVSLKAAQPRDFLDVDWLQPTDRPMVAGSAQLVDND